MRYIDSRAIVIFFNKHFMNRLNLKNMFIYKKRVIFILHPVFIEKE